MQRLSWEVAATMERWGWISALVEPYFLAALAMAVALPRLLFPGTAGWLLGAMLAAGLFWLDHRLAASVSRLPARVGRESMVGQRVAVLETLAPAGVVGLGGERWRAVERLGRRVERGDVARVVMVVGLVLEVELLSTRP